MVGWLVLFVVLWVLVIVLSAVSLPLQFRGRDEFHVGLIIAGFRLYARVVHRVRFVGLEHAAYAARAHRGGRPVIVAPNHTAGVDPILVQAGLGFEPRWMMASDMRADGMEWVWDLGRIIFVDRNGNDARAARTALRHLKDGHALGVFPEGHLERPARTILPFRPGVGLLARGAKALVLPVWIDGTPQKDPAWASLWLPSRSTVTFLEPVDYAGSGLDAQGIADDLRTRLLDASGWEATARTPVITNGHRLLIDLEGRYYDERTGERLTDDEVRERTGVDV
ncbi:MAG: hypothetical protein Tsb0013_12350 [Phycisphaerales bacterium]